MSYLRCLTFNILTKKNYAQIDSISLKYAIFWIFIYKKTGINF